MKPFHGRAIGAQRLTIHGHLVRPGRDEAFGAVVVVACAHGVVAGGDVMPFRRGLVGDGGDAIGHGGPFLTPDAIEIGLAARAASRRPTRSTSPMATAA